MRHDTVVVTGASAGLGRAIAHQFAMQGEGSGVKLALIARNRARLDEARREVEALGGSAMTVPMDVAECGALDRAAERIEEELGPISCWVNNAMVSVHSWARQMEPEEYLRVTEVTYLGYVYGTLAALKRMQPRGRGVILQVGSTLACRSMPLQSAYCAAKHAVVGFTDSLRAELAQEGSGVRVSMVNLPTLNTPRFQWSRSRLPERPEPAGPIFEPEVGARAVLHAATHDVGRELTLTWPAMRATLGDIAAPLAPPRPGAPGESQPEASAAPEAGRRPLDNLWETVRGSYGVRGPFAGRTRERSTELWLRTHREVLAMAGMGVAGLVLGALHGSRQRDGRDATPRADGGPAALDDARANGGDPRHAANPNAGSLASSSGGAFTPTRTVSDDLAAIRAPVDGPERGGVESERAY